MEGRTLGSDYPVGEGEACPLNRKVIHGWMDRRADLRELSFPQPQCWLPAPALILTPGGIGRAGPSHLGHLTFQSRPLLNPDPCHPFLSSQTFFVKCLIC